ncbi:hypothetical protein BTVI_92303 [Pitangus sulphuratus]|nr:hypothetical protein BTVI_92303 [Pitangus sulphuratus]
MGESLAVDTKLAKELEHMESQKKLREQWLKEYKESELLMHTLSKLDSLHPEFRDMEISSSSTMFPYSQCVQRNAEVMEGQKDGPADEKEGRQEG